MAKCKPPSPALVTIRTDQIASPKLYFVKVDVRACFDTIEQEKLLEILTHIISDVRP